MTVYDEAFRSLLFGEGSWIGLLLIVCINIIVSQVKSDVKVLLPILNIFIVFQYMTQDNPENFVWHIIILAFCSIILLYQVPKRK